MGEKHDLANFYGAGCVRVCEVARRLGVVARRLDVVANVARRHIIQNPKKGYIAQKECVCICIGMYSIACIACICIGLHRYVHAYV